MRTTKLEGGLILLLLAACGGQDAPVEPEASTGMSSTARTYLNSALDIMQAHSINRHEIEWGSFRQAAVDSAGTAQTTSDTYGAIRFALRQLGDHHSFFVPAGSSAQASSPLPASGPPPESKLLDGGLGYVLVTAFSGNTAEANALATTYHRMLEGLDTLGVCGWVVDLRGNTGGNMWPMVAGIGPLAGTGILGYFVDPDSVVKTWSYGGGASLLDGYVLAQAESPWTLHDAHPPVAVLTDEWTASSGEATTLAFRGRSDTRSFGTATWGVSTANASYALSDGAVIVLTVSTMADRTGRLYGEKIVPDEAVDGVHTGDPATDAVLARGMEWLAVQEACAGG